MLTGAVVVAVIPLCSLYPRFYSLVESYPRLKSYAKFPCLVLRTKDTEEKGWASSFVASLDKVLTTLSLSPWVRHLNHLGKHLRLYECSRQVAGFIGLPVAVA